MFTISTTNDRYNDIYLDNGGNLAISENANALANISKNAVLTNQGELEYNTEAGIPYFNTIFADTPLIDMFQANIVQTVESLDKVERVEGFEYTQKNGVFSYKLNEITEYGSITING